MLLIFIKFEKPCQAYITNHCQEDMSTERQ